MNTTVSEDAERHLCMATLKDGLLRNKDAVRRGGKVKRLEQKLPRGF